MTGRFRMPPIVWRLFVKLLVGVMAIVLLSILTFGATSFRTPTEVAKSALGRYVDEEQIRAFVDRNQLDRPFIDRYLDWAADMVHGDFGVSIVTSRPISDDLYPALGNTAMLSGMAVAISVPIALLLGIWAASFRDRVNPYYIIVVSFFLAIPDFVYAIILIYVLALGAGLFPPQSSLDMAFGDGFDKLRATVLPALALALTLIPYLTRVTQSALSEIFATPYIQSAFLRGLKWRTIMWDHALRNAASSILVAIGINLVIFMGGVLIVENIFGYPGLGFLIIRSLGGSDIAMLQAASVIFGAMFISINILIEMVGNYFNPKLRDVR